MLSKKIQATGPEMFIAGFRYRTTIKGKPAYCSADFPFFLRTAIKID
jgi:hypothetical protein